MIRLRFVIVAALAGVVPTGCSDPHGGRVEVAGTVKLKGQPVKDGTVAFEPLDGQPTRATTSVSHCERSCGWSGTGTRPGSPGSRPNGASSEPPFGPTS